ncbi:MAG: glycosyltransferase family 4 protein [Candidatus Thorarchaeota archaeon]
MNALIDYKLLTTSLAFPNSDNTAIPGIFIKNQLDSINDSFSEVTVITPKPRKFGFLDKNPHLTDYNYNNVKVLFPKIFYIPRGGLKWFAIDKLQKSIKKVITGKKVEFDLIHAHNGIMGRSCVEISREYKKPLLTSFYGYDAYMKMYDSRYYRNLLTEATTILTLSDHMSQHFEKMGCSPYKIKKLHLGVDVNYFRPKDQQTTIEDGECVEILLVAHFVEKKGIFNAIKAFVNVFKIHKNIRLDLVGRGPLRDQIEDMILSLNLQDKIRITDNYSMSNPRQTVLNFMQNCDIFMLPSITGSTGDSEGTPVVLMEASACAKPCITTFHSGNPEVVLNNKTGIVVPEGNVEELEKALRKLITDDDLRNNLGLNGRKHIMNEFNSLIQSKKLIKIFEKVLE